MFKEKEKKIFWNPQREKKKNEHTISNVEKMYGTHASFSFSLFRYKNYDTLNFFFNAWQNY